LPRINTLVFAGLMMALSGAHLAPAQTSAVANLAVLAGNGQAACSCLTATLQSLQPISVKATDVNGNPVSGATVNWSVTSGQVTLASPTSITGSDGSATEALGLVVYDNFTSAGQPYLVSTIQATSNNSSVTFTETQSLINQQGASVIVANPPTFGNSTSLLADATLSASVGATLPTPIQIQVLGTGQASNGVGNISVRLLNAQTSPILSCASNGNYADPGSVLSSSQGNATCYPTFTGSGTGQYYVMIGGLPAPNVSSALYLQEYGPYTFTSNPGAPTAVQIVSGNYQVANIGQVLNPLVAKLVDGGGNAVQNQTMTFSVTPAGAAALTNSSALTDNNGEVSLSITLDLLASAGAQITIALQSNPSISATFQETVVGAVTAMNKISGDGQTAQVGASFANPLVVQVLNASGPVQNYPVQYQVSGPVSLVGGNTAGTDANGDASVTVKAGTLQGTATVTAIAGSITKVFNLTVTPVSTGPLPNGLAIVTGNSQTAMEGATFISPLVVQVNFSSTAGALSGYVVSFSATGAVTLSSGAGTTNSSGQASVTVTAGNTAGPATVTASISGYPQTFNLTVLPPGPTISASSFLNAASRQVGALSPCSLAIMSAPGLTPDGVTDYSLAPIFGRLPHSVHKLSVTFGGIPAPIVSVAMGAVNPEVTLQVPCEVTPATSVPVVVNVNGGGTATTNIAIQTVSPGIFQTVNSDGTSRAVVVRDDGSFADVGGSDAYDPNNPARLTENVRLYLTGLGATVPQVGTDSIQNPNADLVGRDALVAGAMQAGIVGGTGLQVVSARQAPGLIGVYEVQVFIPSAAPTGNNVQIAIGIVPVGANSAVSSPAATIAIGQ
jgi:uncharacterized protein (TIGR03437 family)